eukprot:Rhum_TRINITY_DN14180_c0_g5::Rhum_TRINITY_DN14180_c0_g5_i1::g.72605::m.72605
MEVAVVLLCCPSNAARRAGAVVHSTPSACMRRSANRAGWSCGVCVHGSCCCFFFFFFFFFFFAIHLLFFLHFFPSSEIFLPCVVVFFYFLSFFYILPNLGYFVFPDCVCVVCFF